MRLKGKEANYLMPKCASPTDEILENEWSESFIIEDLTYTDINIIIEDLTYTDINIIIQVIMDNYEFKPLIYNQDSLYCIVTEYDNSHIIQIGFKYKNI
jgi:hypothetical protein